MRRGSEHQAMAGPSRSAPLAAAGILLVFAAAGCGPQGMFSGAGVEARRVEWLWWLMLAVAVLVLGAISVLLLVALRRERPAGTGPAADEPTLRRALVLGVVLTVALLLVVFLATLSTSRPSPGTELVAPSIRVVGKLWWWEVTYLEPDSSEAFTTANEIRIPVGRPVRLELLSDNVIHSLWVPQLAGKMDLVPGRTNTLTFLANQAGTFRGQCAELCGIQHARMALFVVAEPEEAHRAWLERQREPAPKPTGLRARGLEVFRSAGCAACHVVRGLSTPEGPALGPDLTHLASRLGLAAATLPNRRGHLAGWIANPQALKPGNKMPRVPLAAAELHALLQFLEGLR